MCAVYDCQHTLPVHYVQSWPVIFLIIQRDQSYPCIFTSQAHLRSLHTFTQSVTSNSLTDCRHMCRHVMHAHLTHLSEPSATLQGLTEQSAFFLLSICIRSAEGRKRIVNEIVQTLNPSDKPEARSDEQTMRRPASNPYKVQPGFPAPHKVAALPCPVMNSCTHLLPVSASLLRQATDAAVWHLQIVAYAVCVCELADELSGRFTSLGHAQCGFLAVGSCWDASCIIITPAGHGHVLCIDR